MITSELENELRRTFALADAQITVPGQARQRLLGRDYHPRRRNRRLAVLTTDVGDATQSNDLDVGRASRVRCGSPHQHR